VVNYEFSLSLSRELAETAPDRFLPDVALCLNNLGVLHFRLNNLDACEMAFQEAVEIRRRRPVGSDKFHENLGHSLVNLGNVAVVRGMPEKARPYYEESIRVTAERLPKERSAHCRSRTSPDPARALSRNHTGRGAGHAGRV